jgi:hypothetical protein
MSNETHYETTIMWLIHEIQNRFLFIYYNFWNWNKFLVSILNPFILIIICDNQWFDHLAYLPTYLPN